MYAINIYVTHKGTISMVKSYSRKNKAVYTAAEVTCGWAGAVIRKAGAATQKPPVNAKKS